MAAMGIPAVMGMAASGLAVTVAINDHKYAHRLSSTTGPVRRPNFA
jgi:hypothetical protein